MTDSQIVLLYLEDNQYSDFQISILAYFFRNADIAREKVQTFIKALPASINKNAMSTYDLIVEEGIAKEEIVLGFQPPSVRAVSGFGVS